MGLVYSSLDELNNALAPRKVFLERLRGAVEQQRGFATAKLGNTEAHLLLWSEMRNADAKSHQTRTLETWIKHNLRQYAGVFPVEVEFYMQFAELFRDALREIDIIGICAYSAAALEFELLNRFEIRNTVIRFRDLQTDRSIPDNPANCYLPSFRGKRILIVCPFGNLLAARATREIFEGVWDASGKKFFEPRHVEGLEFPYGFASETWARYETAIDLLREIEAGMDRREFDVALIGAGALGIPLAAHAKKLGKVGIVLGGHLQVLFGVKGERWRSSKTWSDTYFNDCWIEMPEQYRPKEGDLTGDHSYW